MIGKVLNNIDTTSLISPKIITEFYKNINLKNRPLLTESNSFTCFQMLNMQLKFINTMTRIVRLYLNAMTNINNWRIQKFKCCS